MADGRQKDEAALAEALRRGIAETVLIEGGRLRPERQLAQEMGVSRARLRRALDLLEAEGIITRRQGQGTFAAPPPPVEAGALRPLAARITPQDLMEARFALEPEFAARAAERATPAEVQVLERLARATQTAADIARYDVADDLFHYRIAQIAANPLFLAFFESIREVRRQADWSARRACALTTEDIGRFSRQHADLLEAIRTHRSAEARRAMELHLTDVARAMALENSF
jgi:DNA-binding FadR family transcriptional regulator